MQETWFQSLSWEYPLEESKKLIWASWMSRILQVYQVSFRWFKRTKERGWAGRVPQASPALQVYPVWIVVSLPRCQGHAQTRQHHHPRSRAPPAQSSHHLAVPDSLQGHSSRHLHIGVVLVCPWEEISSRSSYSIILRLPPDEANFVIVSAAFSTRES